jgi:UDP-N-acetylmuramyl pentapeptide synthase
MMSNLIFQIKTAAHELTFAAAVSVQRIWRLSSRTLRIGITGSAGKSTTRALLGEILRLRGKTRSPDDNGFRQLSRRALSAGPWFSYWVQELATARPGTLAKTLKIFRPHIAIVTAIGDDHYSAFRSREAIAREKHTLVSALPPGGWAVLNADDPLVHNMLLPAEARRLSFGRTPEADLRAISSSSVWGKGYALEVAYQENRLTLQTGLVGEHWETAVLAAVGGALAAGLSLEDCRAALAGVQPLDGRLSVHPSRGGITFLRDDWKAPLWSLELAFQALKTAGNGRKIAVIGTLSDYSGSASKKYRRAARMALESADVVIFAGGYADSARKAAPENERLLAFQNLYEVHEYLEKILRRGDVVLLKGSLIADHLQRLLLARDGDHACWRARCGRIYPCTECSLRMDFSVPDLNP